MRQRSARLRQLFIYVHPDFAAECVELRTNDKTCPVRFDVIERDRKRKRVHLSETLREFLRRGRPRARGLRRKFG